jgi:lysophospholipase L1-like esterase
MSVMAEKLLSAIKGVEGETNKFKDKWISILGDSISTFGVNYSAANPHYGVVDKQTITDVSQMWWHILLTKIGAKLCRVATCGSALFTKGSTYTLQKKCVPEIYRKAGQSYYNLDGTQTTATTDIYPDIVLIFAGINDVNSNIPLGDIHTISAQKFSTSDSIELITTPSYETADFVSGVSNTLMSIFMMYQQKFGVGGKVVEFIVCGLPSISKWTTQTTEGKYVIEYDEVLRQESRIWGINYLDMNGCFDTCIANLQYFTTDNTHFNQLGMKLFAEKAYQELKNKNLSTADLVF